MTGITTAQTTDISKVPIVLSMHMPFQLVMLRHGESEANLINRALKQGIISEYPPGFDKIPDREIRLSKEGRQQALKTGEWLRNEYSVGFDKIYVSDHTRAKETVGLVCKSAGWHNSEIRIDPLLGERNWGRFTQLSQTRREEIMNNRGRDPLHNPMPDGETLLETRHRSRELLDRCAREFTQQRILVISHGEFIEALWSEISHMNTERQINFFNSEAGNLRNCQVVEFSSIDPQTIEYTGKFQWVRSSCPQLRISSSWQKIERTKYLPEEILAQVERYPNLDFTEHPS
jgi:broad specificity phosphatase PhoE